LLKIEGKTGKDLVKVWDKRWSKLPQILNFNSFKSFVTFAIKKLEILLIFVENFLRMLGRKNFFHNASISPENFFYYAYISRENFFDLTSSPPPLPHPATTFSGKIFPTWSKS
jgi:hypothetical protein